MVAFLQENFKGIGSKMGSSGSSGSSGAAGAAGAGAVGGLSGSVAGAALSGGSTALMSNSGANNVVRCPIEDQSFYCVVSRTASITGMIIYIIMILIFFIGFLYFLYYIYKNFSSKSKKK
jgi:hypothetical protein